MAITVLIVDDEENARQFIGEFLIKKGYEVVGASTLAEARHFLSRGDGDVVLLDVQLPDGYGPNLLYETAHLPLRPPIILITAYGDIQMAVDAMKNGAHDFLSKPIQFNQLEQSLKRATEVIAMRQELEHLRRTQYQQVKFIVGKSTEMRNVVTLADRAASAGVSVLITGETDGEGCIGAIHTPEQSLRISRLGQSTVLPFNPRCWSRSYLGMNRELFLAQKNASMD